MAKLAPTVALGAIGNVGVPGGAGFGRVEVSFAAVLAEVGELFARAAAFESARDAILVDEDVALAAVVTVDDAHSGDCAGGTGFAALVLGSERFDQWSKDKDEGCYG